MKIVYLSLGSNLGDRKANLEAALRLIESPRLRLRRVSSIWETEPVDVKNQAWFLNLVAEVETDLFPKMLLNHVQRVEKKMGRERKTAKGPRNIDLDILLYGAFRVTAPGLMIPHPRMHERRFVLQPMVELAPNLRHPMLRRSMQELLGALQGQALRKFRS